MGRRWNTLKHALTGTLAALTIACGSDGGPISPDPDPDPDPTPDTTAPTGQLSGPQTGETTRELGFTLTADDNNALENASIDWQDGNNTTIELDGTQAQQLLTHTYNKAGEYQPTVALADTAGNTTTLNAEPVRVDWRTMNLDLDARTFFAQEPYNDEVTVRIQNETTGQDTTLTGNGGVTGTVHYGNASLTIDTDGHTEVHRLFVDETPRMTAYENTPITFEPRDELRATIETVDDISYLEDMAAQWTARPVTMRVGETQHFVLYEGYDKCEYERFSPDGKLPIGIECTDDKYRVGIPIDEEFRQGYYTFFDVFNDILADQRIGWQPYDIEVVEADTSEIGEYTNQFGRAKHNVMITYRQGWPHAEGKGTGDAQTGASVLARSVIGVHSGSKPSFFSNEFTHPGSLGESNPPVCSVRDKESEQLDECPVTGETIFYQVDRNNLLLAAAYVAAAQLQGFNPLILPQDHPMVESAPAGVPSLAPGEMQLELDAPLGYERVGRLYVPEGTITPAPIESSQGGLEQAVVDGLAGEDVHVTFAPEPVVPQK